ncbi:hypothetical protein GJAV_G00241430 [Gymnothorax javanicus]|nr:hypothetical protein GJAV_G00241430 [Gymnothorax javanicus]
MAESIVRKIRPFTIGTKLSATVGSKCASCTESYQSNSNQDPDPPPRSLTDQVYLYLGMAGGSQVSAQVSRSEQQQREVGEEEHLNRNAAPHSTCSRTIRKITISSHANSSRETKQPKCDASQKSENVNNNNNKITSAVLPRIIGVSYERKPNSHFKVLLRKDGQVGKQGIQKEESSATRTRASTALQITESRAHSPNQEPPKGEVQLIGQAEAPPTNDCCFTQGNALFNKELQQAEEWMKAKLQELRDLQWRPLQDGLSQGIEKDLCDFENSLIQLNKMGEELLCRPSPTADQVRKQLAQLRDQWQALKEAVASQLKAVGGARDLQEFYKKADMLEAWIKEKEEEPWLTKFQGENIDKMELTRKILDLKEDEQLYRSLHEEINHLALKLEKQGKTEGKNVSTRRKHINKMWQRVQSLLKDYRENLQLALEVSSFYHDADNIISAISNKRKSVGDQNQLETSGDREIRDIGSQVMMLEVKVSQLSKLHPSLAGGVLQKLGEVKEGWGLLQRAIRNERSSLGAPRPDDPLSPSKEQQCTMGAETQRIIGKEIKEEQNRLRGGWICSNTRGDVKLQVQEQSEEIPGRNRKPVDCQDEAQNHASSVTGSGSTPADDIISRAQPERDRKQMSQSKPRIPRGHAQPRPHLHMQLQKFNASADKTLSWLKDSIAVATQVCSTATLDGFNVAKQRQAALEQEIQSNAARIELVKKEGWSLVWAGHPGGGQIEVFLGQLEELWEELRRRHGRSQLLLQEAETLSLEVLHILLQLDALDCWLQGVEESLMGGVGQAEQDSGRLEREVSDWGLQLCALRRDAERLQLRSHTHFLSPQISLRMQQVEERYSRVQSALSQQSTELRDSLMLSQFLERVEQEENQEALGDLPQTPRRETSPRVSPLGLREGVEGDPLLESIGDPVEELREAVEMLNDTVRERGRSLGQEQDLSELFSRHSSLMAQIMQGLSRAAQLTMDLLRAESDMTVRCEPDKSGLQTLQEEQEELETDLAVMEQEMEEMGVFSARPEGLSMGGACLIAPELQTTLQAWEELSRCSAENRTRLHLSLQLHRFFQRYLAMISWTEDTRAYIFSDSTVHDGTGGEQLEDSEMDVKIEQKFGEFEELSSSGQALMEAGHHLSDLIQERMEELRSMLGWILVRWRSQKQQRKNGRKGKADPHGDTIYSEATVSPALRDLADSAANQLSESPGCHNSTLQTEDGYEVMGSMSMWGGALDPPVSLAPPLLLTQEPSAPSVGGATKPGDSHQMETEAERKRVMETVNRPLGAPSSACRVFWRRCQGLLENTLGSLKRNRRIFGLSTEEVSTYLCATDSKAMPPTGGSVALPSPSCHAQVPASPSFPSSSYCSPPWTGSTPSHTPTLPILRLRHRSKSKRKWDVRRHTVQRIMGLEEPLEEDGVACSTHTWPLQVRKKREVPDEECLGYLRNPLAQDIDAECSSQLDLATSLLTPVGPGRNRNLLSSGLNFDLQKGAAFIPSIPDIITIGPAELKPQQERPAPFSTFKQTISNTARVCPKAEEEWSHTKNCSQNTSATIQSDHQSVRSMRMGTLITDQSHLRKSINVLTTDQSRERQTSSSSCSPDQTQTTIRECLSDLGPTKLSNGLLGICSLHEEVLQKWDKMAGVLDFHRQSPKFSALSVSSQEATLRAAAHLDTASTDSTHSPNIGRRVAAPEKQAVSANGGSFMGDTVPPDHRQFEEEEEELKCIWRSSQTLCSDVMYSIAWTPPGYAYEPHPVSSSALEPCPSDSALNYRTQATASAPTILGPELHPPAVRHTHAHPSLNRLIEPHRKSWAAFPSQALPNREIPLVNETAANCVKLPYVQDPENYLYQYKEEEEEEEEEGAEAGCPKVQSMSLLSVHMGGVPNAGAGEVLGHGTPARGAPTSMESEPQVMQGTLEIKHRRQAGGKKAPCRTWSRFHTVLHRQKLHFYQHRKDTLQSSEAGSPLNLIGAECSPALEYSKRNYCFSLRLCDGSEYLLCASSRFLMKKWLLKIQANTGFSESDPSRSFSEPSCQENKLINIRDNTDGANDKEMAVLTRTTTENPLRHSGNLEGLGLRSSSDAGHRESYNNLRQAVKQRLKFGDPCVTDSLGRPSSKRRSQSFTSATYQKIAPVPLNHTAYTGGGSRYSVTMVIGNEPAPTSSKMQQLIGWRQEDLQNSPGGGRSYTSLPRPRNKSVFRRIFGKKEWTHDL